MTAPREPEGRPHAPSAGWYLRGGELRWWNGRSWTEHTAPVPDDLTALPGAAAGPADTPRRVTEAEHLLHAVASLLTCGLWLPVWWLRTASARRRRARARPEPPSSAPGGGRPVTDLRISSPGGDQHRRRVVDRRHG